MYSRLRPKAPRQPAMRPPPILFDAHDWHPRALRKTIAVAPTISPGPLRVFSFIEHRGEDTFLILRRLIDREITRRQACVELADIGYEDWEIDGYLRYADGSDCGPGVDIFAWVVVTALVVAILIMVRVLS